MHHQPRPHPPPTAHGTTRGPAIPTGDASSIARSQSALRRWPLARLLEPRSSPSSSSSACKETRKDSNLEDMEGLGYMIMRYMLLIWICGFILYDILDYVPHVIWYMYSGLFLTGWFQPLETFNVPIERVCSCFFVLVIWCYMLLILIYRLMWYDILGYMVNGFLDVANDSWLVIGKGFDGLERWLWMMEGGWIMRVNGGEWLVV